MKNIKEFDLNFRPNCYWGPQDLKTFFGSRIKGQARKNLATSKIETEDVPSVLLESELNQSLKEIQGQIHPWMMGGEYLSDFSNNEIEISRVVLKSTTMDVCSFRVRKQKLRYVYRIVDEYSNSYELPQKTSVNPLTLEQVVNILDNCETICYDNGEKLGDAGLIKPHIEYLFEEMEDEDEILDFVTVESSFYHEIEEYYEIKKMIWLKDMKNRKQKN